MGCCVYGGHVGTTTRSHPLTHPVAATRKIQMRTDGCLTLVRADASATSGQTWRLDPSKLLVFFEGKYQQPDVANHLINRIKGDRFVIFFWSSHPPMIPDGRSWQR